jgi:hypothetical protein
MAKDERGHAAGQRARRAAARQGMTLHKIRTRHERTLGRDRWLLYGRDGKLVISNVVSGIETGASLDEIERYLATGEQPSEEGA